MSNQNINEEANQAFSELYADVPEIKGIILATNDGLPIVFDLKGGLNAEKVAALVATALGIGRRVMPSLGMGDTSELSVTSNDGKIFVYTLGASAVLCMITQKNVNLGMLFMKANQTIQRLKHLFP